MSVIGVLEFVILIFSVMVHEVAHGLMAESLGDPTARLEGRITLNPLKHLDPVGSVILPGILILTGAPVIGWAKPVPYNPNNLYKDYKYGPLKVALAGPLSNVFLLFVFGLAARFGFGILPASLIAIFGVIALMNIFLAVFNLIPIPPLDGSRILTIFLPRRAQFAVEAFGFAGIFIIFLLLFALQNVVFFVAGWVFAHVAGNNVLNLISVFFMG